MTILFIILGLFVLLVAYFLLFKTAIFLPLVPEELKDMAGNFCKVFGVIYIFVGFGTMITAHFNETIVYMLALLMIFIASAGFSLIYARFISRDK